MKHFGLLGKRLDYSFSKDFFTKKFEQENIAAAYQNIELDNLENLKKIIHQNDISGFNVTIPFKQTIIELLDELTPTANTIEAVNCVRISPSGSWIGHNTDAIGFEKSLLDFIKNEHTNALIFGTGGAAEAVQFVLEKLNIQYQIVSRTKTSNQLSYPDLTAEIIHHHQLLINTTPLGTFPNIKDCIEIPYEAITAQHFCYDVVYNPSQTEFLKRSKRQNAQVKNGLEMLEIQAEESFKIWCME